MGDLCNFTSFVGTLWSEAILADATLPAFKLFVFGNHLVHPEIGVSHKKMYELSVSTSPSNKVVVD